MPLNRKHANAFMAVAFLGFAAVQLNDPDPILWIGIYVLAAAISAAAIIERVIAPLAGMLAFGSASGAVVLAEKVVGIQAVFSSEEGREMMGLGLVAIWIGGIFLRELNRVSRETAEIQDAGDAD